MDTDDSPDRDAPQPGADLATAIPTARVPPHRNECVLHRLEEDLVVSRTALQSTDQPRCVSVVEEPKRGFLTIADALEQRSIIGTHGDSRFIHHPNCRAAAEPWFSGSEETQKNREPFRCPDATELTRMADGARIGRLSMSITRWSTLVLAVLGSAAGGALALGAPVVAAPFLALFAIVAIASRMGDRVPTSDRWDGDDVTTPWAAARRGPSSPAVVGRALGRFEARAMLASPWFGAGLGICLLAVLPTDPHASLNEATNQIMFLAHPLVGMAIIAAHRAATRAARDDTLGVFDTCPSQPTRRTVGVVWAAAVPAAVLFVFALVYLVVSLRGDGRAWSNPLTSVSDVVATCLLGVGGVALGAALGRWIRFPLTPMIAIMIIGFISVNLASSPEPHLETRMIFSTSGPNAEDAGYFTASQAFAHLAWIAALVTATVAVAQVRAADKDDEPLAAVRGTTSHGDPSPRHSQ